MVKLDLIEENYSMYSWSIVMAKFAYAKCIYDNPNAKQSDIDNAILAS